MQSPAISPGSGVRRQNYDSQEAVRSPRRPAPPRSAGYKGAAWPWREQSGRRQGACGSGGSGSKDTATAAGICRPALLLGYSCAPPVCTVSHPGPADPQIPCGKRICFRRVPGFPRSGLWAHGEDVQRRKAGSRGRSGCARRGPVARAHSGDCAAAAREPRPPSCHLRGFAAPRRELAAHGSWTQGRERAGVAGPPNVDYLV